MPPILEEILGKLGIKDIAADIYSMSKSELFGNFSHQSGGLNTTRMIRNLIWQDYRRVQSETLEPFHGNIRSYWYARVKPVLSRAEEASDSAKYHMMIDQFVTMALHNRLFNYRDLGFSDENATNRRLGNWNRHVFLVAEKVGHYPLLEEIWADYDVTVFSFGGQPSALSTEYFLNELEESGFDTRQDVPLFTIVDYDPSGDIIAESFIFQMKRFGYKGSFYRIDLFHPSRLTRDQIRLNKYTLSKKKSERKKNRKWAAKTRGLEPYGFNVLAGLEADTMGWTQYKDVFAAEVAPYLKVPRDEVVRRRLNHELVEVLMQILMIRLQL